MPTPFFCLSAGSTLEPTEHANANAQKTGGTKHQQNGITGNHRENIANDRGDGSHTAQDSRNTGYSFLRSPLLSKESWLRDLESNQKRQVQSLSCYPYTIPPNMCRGWPALKIMISHDPRQMKI